MCLCHHQCNIVICVSTISQNGTGELILNIISRGSVAELLPEYFMSFIFFDKDSIKNPTIDVVADTDFFHDFDDRKVNSS